MELLASPDLIGRVSADLASLGVVGEGTNLVVAYLATVSRKAERPFGVVVQSSSAAGKSTVADAVASFVPEEDLVSLSALTGQALYYLGPNDLARKVLFVSEEQGASRAGYALKLLISEGRLAIASAGKDPETGRLRTRSYGVEGPVALLMTTTAAEIDPELANRLVVLGVDEDRAQTAAVLAAQRRAATLEGLVARLRRDETVRLHRNAQRLLEPLPVVIPGAEGLSFPDFATRHRRDHQKLLSVIASITLLHQHQRLQATTEVGGAVVRYVEASHDDIVLGTALCQEVLIRGADELSPQERRLLSAMGRQTAEPNGAAAPGTSFTRRGLRELTGWSEYQVRVGLARLVALEYVAEQRDRPGRRHRYTLVDEWPPGPRDGSRAISAPCSRAVEPASPGAASDPATVKPISNGQGLARRQRRRRQSLRTSRRCGERRGCPGGEPGQTDWPSSITGGGRCAVQPPGTIKPMTELRITVPVEIAERLASEAAERGTSAEDVAAEVLRLHAPPGSGGHRYGFIGIAKAKPGAPSAAEAEQLLENYQDEEFAR